MSRKKLSIVNEKSAAAAAETEQEKSPLADKIDLTFVERIAAASLTARGNELEAQKQKLEKDQAGFQKLVEGFADEVFKRIGVQRDPDILYLITPEALVKQ